MKVKIAVLEAKSAVRALLVLLAVALCTPQGAMAQQGGERWTSPDGVFSVAIPGGWARVEVPGTAPALLQIEPAASPQGERRALVCGAAARPDNAAIASLGQEQLNDASERVQAAFLARARAVHTSRSEVIQGIRMTSMDIEVEQGGRFTRFITSGFSVASPAGAKRYSISCVTEAPASAVDVAEMRAFVDSLVLTRTTLSQSNTGQRWISPTQAWSIDLDANGWMPMSPAPPNYAHFALVMRPREEVAESDFRICYVSESFVPMPEGGAAQLRTQSEAIDLPRARTMYSAETVQSVTHGATSGVAFVDILADANQGQSQRRHRMFSLAVGDRGMVVDITYSWRASLPSAKLAEMDRIFGSIEIPEPNP